jgi:peptide/nickel transport system substrate-binding protein
VIHSSKFRAIIAGLAVVLSWTTAVAQSEPPLLAEKVRKGELPPMAARLPMTPHVTRLADSKREPGKPGGEIRMIMADQRDLRMMSLYGYSRLIGFNTKQELEPDILQDVQRVTAGRMAHHSPPRISAIGGRMWPTTQGLRPVARPWR